MLDVPSAHTIGHIILEGGIIANVQLVFEFMNVECEILDIRRSVRDTYHHIR